MGENRKTFVGLRILIAVAAILVVFWLAQMIRVQLTGNRQSKAKVDIVRVLKEQQEAWNEGKLEAFMEGYYESDDLRFFSGGNVTHGWNATLDRYRKKYQGEGKEMGSLDFQNLEVSLIGEDNAIVRGRFELTYKDGKKPWGLFTLWFRRLPEGWRIVHDHTSVPESP
jgi:ketosteroid isomerase-like protein